MVSHSSKPGPSVFKKRKYTPSCDVDEESISDMLKKNSILTQDEMDFEIEGETASEETSNEKSKSESGSESESETCGVSIDLWKEVTIGDKKPKAYTFTKSAWPQFNLLPDAEPMDYFSLLFNDELLNNIVIETNRNVTHN
jgi:hypothetical protein